jgi:hypothetical protein
MQIHVLEYVRNAIIRYNVATSEFPHFCGNEFCACYVEIPTMYLQNTFEISSKDQNLSTLVGSVVDQRQPS